ncbi:sulfite exporter TauE/SafE family protein [Sporosarcina sp. NCCP-2222]|uniref:urease accessory protein UreH domain-containing protein n=1 Tax=Sporosarcina sp. NCCP-2222 TaxID=2935073 RepID=UPI0020BF26F5|nr:sulfite exporter TauE/SafE family protein [Sporosarcina sp. NCCP-2222]
MYGWMSAISQWITEPVTVLLQSYEQYPIVVAFLLGVIGAVAPCQLTGNLSAVTLYGNQTIQLEKRFDIAAFIGGKVAVFSLLGLFAWMLGDVFSTTLTGYFPVFRKMIGPLLIVTGLVMIGMLRFGFLRSIPIRMPMKWNSVRVGSFLLGASFSLAFCPTMFVLFFFWLMPLVATNAYGFLLPSVFGIATSLPLLLLLLFIWFFDAKRLVMRISRRVGLLVQRLAGGLIILIGIADSITYWSL